VVVDFAGLHARVNLGGKWKGKKLTDEQKRYVLNLRKENHEDNVRVRKQKRARDKEAAQEAAATSKKGRRCKKKNRGFSVTCIRTGGYMPHANWLSS
jgi:sRNA-binding protein